MHGHVCCQCTNVVGPDLERTRAQEVVLLVQDTPFLAYGTTHPKGGMGTVKIKVHEEYLLHPTVAFTPARVNLGVVGIRVIQFS